MFTSGISKVQSGGSLYQYGNRRHVSCASFADAKLAAKFMKLVKENDYKAVHKMVKKGFDVNVVLRFEGEMEKMTALHYAVKEGMPQMLKELLTWDCDVNVVTAFDNASPLHFACELQDNDLAFAIAEDLINAGADVNMLDHAEKSPLVSASERGNLSLVRLLLDNEADINHRYQEETYPYSLYQAFKFVTFSPPESDEKVDAYHKNSSLIQACRAHHAQVVKELVYRGADINLPNRNGNTPLHIACMSECKDVYANNLTRAPVAGHALIVKFLLESGSKIDAENSVGDTPLKRALDGIVELSHWQYPVQDRIEESLQMFDIAQILLHSGCKVTGHYKEGDYYHLDAPKFHYKTALNYLLHAGKAIQSYKSVRVQKSFETCLNMLLAAGCTIDIDDVTNSEEFKLPERVIEAVKEHFSQPSSLKKLCNQKIRGQLQKPLKENIANLGLPQVLSKLVSLEIID